jgi:hypothetical protein
MATTYVQLIAGLNRRHLARGQAHRLILLQRINVWRVGNGVLDFAYYGVGLLRGRKRRKEEKDDYGGKERGRALHDGTSYQSA